MREDGAPISRRAADLSVSVFQRLFSRSFASPVATSASLTICGPAATARRRRVDSPRDRGEDQVSKIAHGGIPAISLRTAETAVDRRVRDASPGSAEVAEERGLPQGDIQEHEAAVHEAAMFTSLPSARG